MIGKTGSIILIFLMVILVYNIIPLLFSSLTNLPNSHVDHLVLAFNPTNQSGLTVETDKKAYGLGDYVVISGSVKNVVKDKTVRIDVYLPSGAVASANNATLSNIHLNPSNNGFYSTTIHINSCCNQDRGAWRVASTYDRNTVESNFTVG
jgi:hypothetical protein